MRFIYWI